MIHGNIYHHISCLFNSQHSYSFFIFLPGRYRAGRRRCRGEAARWGWLETSHDVAVVPTAACEKTSSRFHQVPVIFAQEASPSVFWNGKKSSFALHSSIFIFHLLAWDVATLPTWHSHHVSEPQCAHLKASFPLRHFLGLWRPDLACPTHGPRTCNKLTSKLTNAVKRLLQLAFDWQIIVHQGTRPLLVPPIFPLFQRQTSPQFFWFRQTCTLSVPCVHDCMATGSKRCQTIARARQVQWRYFTCFFDVAEVVAHGISLFAQDLLPDQ